MSKRAPRSPRRSSFKDPRRAPVPKNPAPIASAANPRVKEIRRLRRKKNLDGSGRLALEGVRLIREALDAGVEISQLVVCEELAKRPEARKLLPRLKEIPRLEVTASVFATLAEREDPVGLLAVVKMPPLEFSLLPSKKKLWLLADGVQRPGNLGNIIRVADAVAADGVIALRSASPFSNQSVIASLGAIFTVPLAADSAGKDFEKWLAERHAAEKDFQIVTTSPAGEKDFTEVDWRRPTLLVLGSEQFGASEDLLKAATVTARLPMRGKMDSLNVATTTAVVAFECLRARGEISL